MRVALYNQMFGLDGRKLSSFITGHLAVHYQSNPEKIWKKADISKTLETISKVDADILGVIEVLEGQEEELKKGLRKQGYGLFFLGKGHKTKYSGLHVQEMIASKIQCYLRVPGGWPVKHSLGGGGGLVHTYCSDQQFNVVLAHLSLPSKGPYFEQMDFLQNYLRKLRGKIIILGDFNKTFKELEQGGYFRRKRLVSDEIKTCPITKWLKFLCKDVDHIFVRGFEKIGVGSLERHSDHKLIYVDLE